MSKGINKNSNSSEGTLQVPGELRIEIFVGGPMVKGSLDVESERVKESPAITDGPTDLGLIAFLLDNRMIREIYDIIMVDVLKGTLVLLDIMEEEVASDGAVEREILEGRLYCLSEIIVKAYLEPFNDPKAEGYTYVDEVEDEVLWMVFYHLCDILDGAVITEGDDAE